MFKYGKKFLKALVSTERKIYSRSIFKEKSILERMFHQLMEWIATYLWELFIFVEVIFWLLIILFLILRYILQWKSASIGILPLFVATIIADLFLGWVDYQQTGEFSLFQIIVVIFVIYAVTSGRSDFQRLDAWVQRKIAAWKGEPEPELTVKPVPIVM